MSDSGLEHSGAINCRGDAASSEAVLSERGLEMRTPTWPFLAQDVCTELINREMANW